MKYIYLPTLTLGLILIEYLINNIARYILQI